MIADMRALPPPGASAFDFPRSAAGVQHLVRYAERAGLAAEPLLIGTGLRVSDLSPGPGGVGVVTAAQELRVVRALARRLPAAGADVGRRYTVDSFGVMGWAMLASATVGQAVDVALRFIDLSFAFVIPVARVEGEQIVAELDATGLPSDVRRWLLARDATAVATVLDSLVPGGVGLTLTLGEDRGVLSFPAGELDRPLVRERGTDRDAAEAACAEITSSRRRATGTAADVRVLIAQRLRDGAPMRTAASALGVTERTLRRWLDTEGTSYRRLLDEVRAGLAAELLAVGLPVADVAARLGYAETAALTHAHRRWTGRPPSTARAR